VDGFIFLLGTATGLMHSLSRLNRGGTQVFIYLFRDESGCNTFAYSTDVTGRNIPQPTPAAKWSFVAALADRDIENFEDVRRRLRQHGYYVFQR
jgi:hypothetical protein